MLITIIFQKNEFVAWWLALLFIYLFIYLLIKFCLFPRGAVGAGKVGLAVVKGGKRPRAASVTVEGDGNNAAGGNAFETLLDSVVGGGASFAKLKGGLPQWPAGEDNDETDSGFADDEL